MSRAPDETAEEALDRDPPRRGARIGVAVSGGPDSAAALRLAARRGRRDGFEVVALHVDHGLRPESADEAAFVRALAAEAGVPCDVRRVVVQGAARGRSFEGPARDARFAAFAAASEERSLDRVLVAHSKEDRLETALLALLRGAGFAGLAGMAFRRPLTPRCDVWRPFLRVPRAALRGESGLATLDDPTNRDVRRRRNALRLETLPLLAATDPAFIDHVADLADAARAISDATERGVRLLHDAPSTIREPALLSLATATLVEAARLVRPRFWLDAFMKDAHFGGAASEGMLKELATAIERRPDRREVRRGVFVDVGPETTTLHAAAPSFSASTTAPAPGEESVLDLPGGRRLRLVGLPADASPLEADSRTMRVFAAPGAPIVARSSVQGEAFPLETSAGRGRVREVLKAAKIPEAWRSRVPVATVDGVLRWIVGVRRVRTELKTAPTVELRLDGPAPWAR